MQTSVLSSRFSGCPLCSNQVVVSGVNDLKKLYPSLSEEWDYEKNKCSPEQVGAGSDKKVWRKCYSGHSWEARINSRVRGNGCPICSKYYKTSLKEFIVYYYVSQNVTDAIQSYKAPGLKNKELDIYIPSISTGIEFDGQEWHKKVSRDIEKDELCHNQGIRLIRIREPKCELYCRNDPTIVLEDTTFTGLQIGLVK